ncbi:L-histidine N(alpha)-methyltransferase [Catenulispora subtropica]|uniref:Histidine-specific methyltransferase SAM-dependent domain-containing protein n=1 Tax=Catenulispora subtropica TaxID=450798 RepID=A0ABN2TH67_9ACTN
MHHDSIITSDRAEQDALLTAAPFFESPAHREQLAECLGKGFVPLKLAYTGSAAFTHDRLARSTGYQQVIGQVRDEVEVWRSALGDTPDPLRLVEIGPGNGVHSEGFLRGLTDGRPSGRYLAADFSRTLLGIALARIDEGCGPDLAVTGEVWDIEAGPTPAIERWREGDDPVSLCLLGNTLGNVEEPIGALENIAASARVGDMLLMSVTLAPPRRDDQSLLAPYETEVFRAAVLEIFAMAGIPLDAVRLAVDVVDNTVFGRIDVTRRVVFEDTELGPGDRIRCFVSRRFAVGEVQALLAASGWVTKEEVDSGGHLVVAAFRK